MLAHGAELQPHGPAEAASMQWTHSDRGCHGEVLADGAALTQRRAAELDVAIHALNRMLGRPAHALST